MRPTRRASRLISVLSGSLLALGAMTAVTPGAQAAASDVSTVADALKKSPVYVDPAASAQLSAGDADALSKKIKDADKPVMVAVLPANFPTQDLFTDLRTKTGITGVYAVRLGQKFDARADSRVMSQDAVRNLTTSVQGENATRQLNDFVDTAVRNARGSAPSAWGAVGAGSGAPVGALIGIGAVVVAAGGAAYVVSRRRRRQREDEQRAALEQLRVVVDEDITAFGEELDRLDFHPAEPGADDAMRADYERALDSYEKAKQFMAAAQRPRRCAG